MKNATPAQKRNGLRIHAIVFAFSMVLMLIINLLTGAPYGSSGYYLVGESESCLTGCPCGAIWLVTSALAGPADTPSCQVRCTTWMAEATMSSCCTSESTLPAMRGSPCLRMDSGFRGVNKRSERNFTAPIPDVPHVIAEACGQ